MTNKEQVQLKQLTNKVAKYEWLLGVHRELHRPTFIESEDLQYKNIDLDNLPNRVFYEQYYIANKPLYVCHFTYFNVTLDALKILVGNEEVEILKGREGMPNYERVKNKLKHKIMFHDYVELLKNTESSNDFYMVAYNENQHLFGKLFAQLKDIDWLNSNQGFIWLGPKGTLTPWHYDLTNNLLLQLMGEKKILLIPSWDLPLARNNDHVFCDLSYKNRFANPTPNEPEIIEVVLKTGDMLLIPVGWAHYVESLSTSLTITYTDFAMPNGYSKTFPGYHDSPKL